ncbi:MAG: extracellular solute-binding protein [Verrucomicrobia bacterium]|nr:extracellular solute-binding protein [Verrucomicrobiota bacterium]
MTDDPVSERNLNISRRGFLESLGALGVGSTLAGLWTDRALGATTDLSMIGIAQPMPGRGMTKVLDDFQKQKSVRVNYQYLPSERFVALFTAAQNANQPIDVIFLNGQDTRRYASSGALVPLETLINYQDRFLPKAIETFTINGHLWGVPSGAVAGFPLLVNKKLLDDIGAALPTTYDDLLSIRRELDKKGVSTFTHPGRNIYLWPVWFFTTYAQVTGNQSEQKTIDLLKNGGSFTEPETIEALDLIFRFARDGMFAPDVLSADTDSSLNNFLRGKAAFWMCYDGTIAAVRQANPSNMDLNVQLMPRLVNDTAVKSQFPGSTGNPLCLYQKVASDRKEASLALIDYLSSDAVNAYLVKDSQQSFPVNVHAEGSPDSAALQEKKLLGQLTTYLDWYWPPEITAAFQQGIQAGVAKLKTAQQAAQSIEATWKKVQASGYKFPA